jgi:hypothetical protein
VDDLPGPECDAASVTLLTFGRAPAPETAGTRQARLRQVKRLLEQWTPLERAGLQGAEAAGIARLRALQQDLRAAELDPDPADVR